jgi:hypothetical protein
MKRSLVLASLVLTGMAASELQVQAGHRRHCCCNPRPACCVPAPSCAAPQTPPAQQTDPSPQPQANRSNGYQSFSYEPGTTASPAPATFAPARRAVTNSFYDSVRGDRKVRGY